MKKIDKLGECPNCGKSWDDGDILENLNRMSVFTHTYPPTMKKVAAAMGYSEDNKTHFSSVIVHQFDGKTLYECPRISCKHVFNIETGEEYTSLFEFKQGKQPIKEEEDDYEPREW